MKNLSCSVFFSHLILLLVIGVMTSWNLHADLQFPNPSLEEDTPNIGHPDGWTIPKSTICIRDEQKVSHGHRAMRFESGYILMSCDLKSSKIAGLKLNISLDAAGKNGANLGVIVGTMRRNAAGKKNWGNTMVAWNKPLSATYQRFNIKYQIPRNAVGERIFIAFYRCNRKGVVWLDNLNLLSSRSNIQVTPQQKKQLNLAERDWNFLLQRLECARQLRGNFTDYASIKKAIDQALRQIAFDDLKVLAPTSKKQLTDFQVKINQVITQNKSFLSYLDDAYQRLSPAGVISQIQPSQLNLPTCGGEYQAVGLVVVNGNSANALLPVTIQGGETAIEKIQLRRQVFMPNWYEKDKNLIADPLTLLPGQARQFNLALARGEIVKLYANFKFKKQLTGAIIPLKITVGNQILQVNFKTSSQNLPQKPHFANFQCLYTDLPMAGEAAARDLAEHYTTGIEFPNFPGGLRFEPNGNLATPNLKSMLPQHLLKIYAKYNLKMGLFWGGKYHRFPIANGKNLPYVDKSGRLTPEWKNAYTNFLKSWWTEVQKLGYNSEHFFNWCLDELGTHEDFANPPGQNVKTGREIYRLGHQGMPQVKRMITAGFYTRYEDIQTYIDQVEIILPHWPMPERLTRYTLPGYNPRKVFFEKTLPLLMEKKRTAGLTVWSYKVDAGKKEPVINARIYPLCAVALGFTGVGSWAYNCSRNNTTWDDTDGGLLDYIFVYNGREKHPLNTQYNVTGEEIVPSIRWEALRMGIQDAKILLYLKTQMEQDNLSSEQSSAVQKILNELNGYARNLNYNWSAINRISAQLRNIINK